MFRYKLRNTILFINYMKKKTKFNGHMYYNSKHINVTKKINIYNEKINTQ